MHFCLPICHLWGLKTPHGSEGGSGAEAAGLGMPGFHSHEALSSETALNSVATAVREDLFLPG